MGESKRRRQSGPVPSAGGRAARAGGRFRLTWRGVGLFMLGMFLLDLIFYTVFRFGFDTCYAVLCLFD